MTSVIKQEQYTRSGCITEMFPKMELGGGHVKYNPSTLSLTFTLIHLNKCLA